MTAAALAAPTNGGALASSTDTRVGAETVVVARAVTRTDPRGDASPATLDILRTRARVGHRVSVNTRFDAMQSGTGYLAFADPGRRGGGVFRFQVRVRRDMTSVGRLMWHAARSQAGHFASVPCAGLRTSATLDTTSLAISAPRRCLRRLTPLGHGIWMSLNSFALPLGPASGDLLPDSPSQAFWVPRG